MKSFIDQAEERHTYVFEQIREYELDRIKQGEKFVKEFEELKKERLNALLMKDKEKLNEKLRDKQHHDPAKRLKPFTEATIPYNAHFIIDDKRFGEQEYLLGKQTLFDQQNKVLIVNWRRPVASIYYGYDVGDPYEEPIGPHDREGILKEKCTFTMFGPLLTGVNSVNNGSYVKEGGEWQYHKDKRIASPSESKEVTGEHHLPDIVALIDKDQYSTIRHDTQGIIHITGPAGSGKTTTMIYKLSWILYNFKKQFQPEDCLVVVFNKSLKDYLKNTISKQIDSKVRVETFHSWALSAIRGCGIKFQFSINVPQKFDWIKRSTFIAKALIEFESKKLKGVTLLEALFMFYADIDLLLSHAGKKKEKEIQAFSDYYRERIKNPHKEISFSDAGPLVRLLQISQYRRNPKVISTVLNNLSLVAMDEAQDISNIETQVLYHACRREPSRCMIIASDKNQHILDSVENASKLDLGDSTCATDLKITYRCTDQINQVASSIMNLDYKSGGRQGDPVLFSLTENFDAAVNKLREIIKAEREKHPNSLIAVVVRYKTQVKKLYTLCKDIEGTRYEERDFTYKPGCCFLNPEIIKGIEYSSVIFFNPSERYFPSSKPISKNLIYMTCTRACDRLSILCYEKPSVYLESFFKF